MIYKKIRRSQIEGFYFKYIGDFYKMFQVIQYSMFKITKKGHMILDGLYINEISFVQLIDLY
jgi:hypothetical protein